MFDIDLARKQVIWEKSDVFIGIYSPFKVLSSTKKVSYCVTLARPVDEFEIIILQKLVPARLTRGNLLWGFEIFKVFMIGSDQELLLRAQKEVSKCFYGINDSK